MKISSNLQATSTYSESYVKQNKADSKKNETEKLNASKDNFRKDRIVTAQGARTAEECGLVTGKNFANKTTVAGADGSTFTVSSYYDARTYAKENLNEEQRSYINNIMQAKTNYLVQRQNEWVASNLSEVQSEVGGNSTGREKYYALGSYKIATDMDLANEIKDMFSNVDYLVGNLRHLYKERR